MRTEFINLFAEINARELENLTREIKEVVPANTPVATGKPVFTAANLWNIQNRKRAWGPRKLFVS